MLSGQNSHLSSLQRILDATYVYGDPFGGYIPIEDTQRRGSAP